MWSKIISYIPSWVTLFQAALALIIPNHRSFSDEHNEGHANQQHEPSSKITGNYDSDFKTIREVIGENSDAHFREFVVKKFHARSVFVFIKGMQDKEIMNKQVLQIFDV
ncbi:hypothetical protein ABEW60_15010 [Paenibacillus jamilae]